MANSKSSKKTNNTTIRTQEQKEPKEMLRNVIKRRKTINKLNNTKKKKFVKQSKRNYRKKLKTLDHLVLKLTLYLNKLLRT